MLRFLFRMLGMIALAVAVIMMVIDATRTIAAGTFIATPLIESWQAVSPQTLSAVRALIEAGIGPAIWEAFSGYLLGLPGFAIFTVLALIFFFFGRRPDRRLGRFAVEG